ncbi:SMI1/KNR4 family protein [Flavobacterium sp. KACC 22763]|uniref:SMI1/KNR4 family protein n=1 Tax=Flavobacterium sp. KACC 22763 TaxID=3025668 RepID=UPI002365C39F|nr:SMI1/KNR4 family protein [Flavobacterium sp. KACC 22763]WDF65696.1 SMI1/KNR4 family protein [Flavobacterium sp. KACC 22763]
MKSILSHQYIDAYKSKLDIFDQFMNTGANINEINKLEDFIEAKLPESYINLLETYNGENRSVGFMGGFSYLGIEEIKMQWTFLKEAPEMEAEAINQVEKIKNTLYCPKRIPFAYDGSGNYLAIDFNPNSEGTLGQILYLPTGDPEPIAVIADSFDDFLVLIMEKLESEQLELIDERDDWDEEDWHMAEIYFQNTWENDWSDIAAEYNTKNGN